MLNKTSLAGDMVPGPILVPDVTLPDGRVIAVPNGRGEADHYGYCNAHQTASAPHVYAADAGYWRCPFCAARDVFDRDRWNYLVIASKAAAWTGEERRRKA